MVSLGCLGYVCVGGNVVTQFARTGQAIAINPQDNQVAVRTHDTGLIGIHDLQTLLIELQGCISGICTTDAVTTSSNRLGTVLALSPVNQTAAIRLSDTGLDGIHPLVSLGITQYCERYGDTTRQAPPSMPAQQLTGMVHISIEVDLGFDLGMSR